MRRQQYLTKGMRLTTIMSEAPVRQQVGGPTLMRKQLHHLTRMVREYDVTVQVVPFAADAHTALCDQFEIIQWPLETDPEAVYVDGQISWMVSATARSGSTPMRSVRSRARRCRHQLIGPPPTVGHLPARRQERPAQPLIHLQECVQMPDPVHQSPW